MPAGMYAPPRRMELMDLATFNNFVNKSGGQVQVTGTHQFKNVKNDKKANIVFNDQKDGQVSAIENFNNAGNASFSGNHVIKNNTNSGKIALVPRKFKDKKKKLMLMDLATFGNFANAAGGNAQFQGTHTVKNLTNAKKGNVVFKDQKQGQFVTVQNANNAGNMQVSGNHVFNNASNSGQMKIMPR